MRNEIHRWKGPFEVLPITDRSRVALALLGLVGLAGLGSLWADLGQLDIVDRAIDGERISIVEATESDDRVGTFAIGYTVAVVLAAIGFLLWYSRALRNTIALGARDPRWGPGWAVGYWFIPFVSLVRPKQVMNDIWRASDPALDGDASGWRLGSVSPLLHVWWIFWLVSVFVERFVFRIVDEPVGPTTTPDDLRDLAVGYVVADATDLVALALAIAVVVRTSSRQAQRIDRFERGDLQPAAVSTDPLPGSTEPPSQPPPGSDPPGSAPPPSA